MANSDGIWNSPATRRAAFTPARRTLEARRSRAINDVRRNLHDCQAEVSLEVIEALLKHNACARESIEILLKTPTM